MDFEFFRFPQSIARRWILVTLETRDWEEIVVIDRI